MTLTMVPKERSYHKENMQNMKALSLTIQKLWPMLKLTLKNVTFIFDLDLD